MDATSSEFTVSRTVVAEQVAGIRTGMRFEELVKFGQLVRDTTTRTPDGADFERAVSMAIGHDTVIVFLGSGSVDMIEISTTGLRTIDGLGVGSRVDALLGQDHASAEVLHGNAWIEIRNLCGVYFLAPVRGAETGEGLDSIALRRLAEESVVRVLVTRCSRS